MRLLLARSIDRDKTLPQRTTAIPIFIPNCIASKSVPDHAPATRHIDPVNAGQYPRKWIAAV